MINAIVLFGSKTTIEVIMMFSFILGKTTNQTVACILKKTTIFDTII